MLLIRDLLCGKVRFKDFLESPERIATNVLTDRLKRLVKSGLVEKDLEGGAKRGVYRLTAKGLSLLPVLEAIRDWGLANIRGTEARMQIPEEE